MYFFCVTSNECNFQFVELCAKFNARDFFHSKQHNSLRDFRDIYLARQFLVNLLQTNISLFLPNRGMFSVTKEGNNFPYFFYWCIPLWTSFRQFKFSKSSQESLLGQQNQTYLTQEGKRRRGCNQKKDFIVLLKILLSDMHIFIKIVMTPSFFVRLFFLNEGTSCNGLISMCLPLHKK